MKLKLNSLTNRVVTALICATAVSGAVILKQTRIEPLSARLTSVKQQLDYKSRLVGHAFWKVDKECKLTLVVMQLTKKSGAVQNLCRAEFFDKRNEPLGELMWDMDTFALLKMRTDKIQPPYKKCILDEADAIKAAAAYTRFMSRSTFDRNTATAELRNRVWVIEASLGRERITFNIDKEAGLAMNGAVLPESGTRVAAMYGPILRNG